MSDFSDAIKKHGISLQKIQIRKLEEYVHLLWSWNERINLTRHTDYDKFAARDITDSLALAEFLRHGEKVLDVGTGGGVPGIILAIVRPDLNIELCDSTGKKALAVSEMLQELRLKIPVHHAKAATLLAEKGRRYTTLTIRAVSRLAQLLRHFAPCWSSFSRMLLVKGPNWIAERGEARHYNLTTKLALRRLKTYTAAVASKENAAAESAESVILQLCLKEDFDQIDAVIDKHRTGRR
ncbi:MAG: 16S rRNA (guanine(527)-N(7))-methyltransferase RsmG [Planctomycetaceae bacterium]|jgi:16S rRNA (guanine527-N7)-methyltransferase|nr:16S rRNA (guanine(527)-N(7))-methyltransferase RsmG [Planctomycetaceae bacterium]